MTEEATKKALLSERKAEKALKELIFLLATAVFFNRFEADSKAVSIIVDMGKELPREANPEAVMSGMWVRYNLWYKTLIPLVQTKVAESSRSTNAKELMKELNETEEGKKKADEIAKQFEIVGSDSPVMVGGSGESPIDIWGGTEASIRHAEQEESLMREFDKPYDLYRISVHLNCSDRCLPDQGKIISKTLPAIDDEMWTGKTIDGRKIYSWQAMHARVDRYGYHNFIIDGFNCRHHVTPYDGGLQEKPPKEEAEEVNEAESEMRRQERYLRQLYGRYMGLLNIDSLKANETHKKWSLGVKAYEAYALKNKLTPQGWRTK